MRVIGIDPGSYRLGYGIVEQASRGHLKRVASGVINLSKRLPPEERLLRIHARLSEIVQEFRPEEASVEEVFFAVNVKTALSLGQVRGVVLLCLCQAGIRVQQFSASEVKKAVTGYGRADKFQVQSMVKQILGLDELPEPDEADALALAICHINTRAMYEFKGS